jgi:hypothetical protein
MTKRVKKLSLIIFSLTCIVSASSLYFYNHTRQEPTFKLETVWGTCM